MKSVKNKSWEKQLKDFLLSPVFYTILLGIVIVIAIIVLAYARQNRHLAGNAPVQQPLPPNTTRNAQQTVTVRITNPESTETKDGNQSTEILQPDVVSQQTSCVYGQALKAYSRFKIDRFRKLAVQPLKFDIYNDKGNLLTPEYLKTWNEQKVHFYLISANLKEFQHLNPVFDGGVWNVKANMPNPGTYYAYSFVTTVKNQRLISVNELVVQEPTSGAPGYPASSGSTAVFENYKLATAIKNDTAICRNYFNMTVTKAEQPALLQPIFGSFGDVVIVLHNEPQNLILGEQLMGVEDNKGRIDFSAYLEKKGTYTMFAQFRVDGRFMFFPITFESK